ncbi:MAG TPA: hypothetical protein ENF41_05035 [Candidatus Bathyarchaeota archaeon]|nr:hypothetical protein [Candidatus Bathyarchaeota archaeon]
MESLEELGGIVAWIFVGSLFAQPLFVMWENYSQMVDRRLSLEGIIIQELLRMVYSENFTIVYHVPKEVSIEISNEKITVRGLQKNLEMENSIPVRPVQMRGGTYELTKRGEEVICLRH